MATLQCSWAAPSAHGVVQRGHRQAPAATGALPSSSLQQANVGSQASSLRGRAAAFKAAAARPAAHAAARPAALGARAQAAAAGGKGEVAITGATGLVGQSLVRKLLAEGYKVKALTRNVAAARSKLPPTVQLVAPAQWAAAVCGTAAVVNLAGEPIATRWSPEIKAEVKRSRVATTSSLATAINACPKNQRPGVLVSSSAVGYYGSSDTQTFSETSASGRDYLAEVCREWEAAAEGADTRVVVLRTGIVLSKEGGALGRMVPVFSIFAGGPLGSGRQWMSWIHRDDLVGLILESIRNPAWKGVYNATAPNPVRMGELCSALGSVMGRPSFFPVPDFALRTLLGEGAQVVLEGQRVLPSRAQDAGYKFQYTRVGEALQNLMR